MKKPFSEFQNCLRIQITPDEYANERIERLVACCKKYGYTNVMFLTTAEEFFLGHITPEEIKPWTDVIKKASALLRENGISIGLHHWIGVGHIDRGIPLKENQNFTTMVDFNGRRSVSVACPLDEVWQKHFENLLGFLIAEIKPDYYWIEDDFRLHNHLPLEWGGCFCEKHIAEFNKLLGTNYTREEFCEKAFAKGEPTKERKAWLDISKKTMLDFAALIKKTIKTANPSTDVALMTSAPEQHCLEARDWAALYGILSGENQKLNRIHLPGYFERSGKDYMYDFNAISMAIRKFSPPDTEILPELENGSANLYRKNAKYLGFQLESSIPLCLSGMTYNIYDPVGNGPVEEFGYSAEVKRLTPYMQAVMNSGARFCEMEGVVIPIDEKIAYSKKITKNFYDLKTNLFNTAAYASALGLAYQYSTDKKFSGKLIFLFGDAVYIFTDDQLTDLFANNNVIVDGGAVMLLKERGLLHLIGAVDAEIYRAETGNQIYEQISGDTKIFGVSGLRASCRVAAGDFVKIEYENENYPEILSRVYKADRTLGWNSFAKGKNFLVNPFVINKLLHTQFAELRRYFVTEFVKEKAEIVLDSEFGGINPYLYCGENTATIMLVNATLENFQTTEFYLKGIEFDKISVIGKDGALHNAQFTKNGNNITVQYPLEYMSTTTLILSF